jgi:hypothetical protein
METRKWCIHAGIEERREGGWPGGKMRVLDVEPEAARVNKPWEAAVKQTLPLKTVVVSGDPREGHFNVLQNVDTLLRKCNFDMELSPVVHLRKCDIVVVIGSI